MLCCVYYEHVWELGQDYEFFIQVPSSNAVGKTLDSTQIVFSMFFSLQHIFSLPSRNETNHIMVIIILTFIHTNTEHAQAPHIFEDLDPLLHFTKQTNTSDINLIHMILNSTCRCTAIILSQMWSGCPSISDLEHTPYIPFPNWRNGNKYWPFCML